MISMRKTNHNSVHDQTKNTQVIYTFLIFTMIYLHVYLFHLPIGNGKRRKIALFSSLWNVKCVKYMASMFISAKSLLFSPLWWKPYKVTFSTWWRWLWITFLQTYFARFFAKQLIVNKLHDKLNKFFIWDDTKFFLKSNKIK